MDGLECSEVELSTVLKTEKTFRIDSEYYQKKYIAMSAELSLLKAETLRKHTAKIDVGFVGPMVDEFTDDIQEPILLQTKNINEFFVNDSNCVHINKAFHQKLKNSKVHYGDVLIARSGSFGKASIYLGNTETNSSDIIIVETKKELNPFYLTAFLNSRLGKTQLFRFASGGLQGHVNLTILENLQIPILGDSFQKTIEKIILAGEKCINKSKSCYKDAEDLLIAVLCIAKHSTTKQAISVKSFTESFSDSGRLDAEYYQSKYADYEAIVYSNPCGFTYVKNAFSPVKTKCNRSEKAYNYIEIGDVDVGTGNASYNVVATDELPDNAKIMAQVGDVIVSTVRPNRGAVAILELPNNLVSGAFTVLRQKGDYSKEVLQVLLRSSMYRDWLLRYNVGTSYPVIKDDDVLNMPIPIFDSAVEKKVVHKIAESHALRRQSEQLLEYAKRAVEIATEQDEEKAMKWLKEKGAEG